MVTTQLPLPDTSSADLNLKVTLYNHTEDDVNGTLKVKFKHNYHAKDGCKEFRIKDSGAKSGYK